MTNELQFRKVQRQKAKLRIGLSGASGSGKTYSALLLASGITSLNKVCVIDTENGSADLYDNLGEYNVLPLAAPFTPERYVEAIKMAEDAGMEVIIVDSVTHEWDGKGGSLESNELLAQTRFKGNSWAAWSVTTPRHQKFIEALVQSNCHIITTARMKTDTAQIEGRIKKVGTKEIQREGFEYELTLNFNIDRDNHVAIASKDRTGIFIDTDPFVITKKTGEIVKEWAEKGIKPLEQHTEPVHEKTEDLENPVAKLPPIKQEVEEPKLTIAQQRKIYALRNEKAYTDEKLHKAIEYYYKKDSITKLTVNEAFDLIKKMENPKEETAINIDEVADEIEAK